LPFDYGGEAANLKAFPAACAFLHVNSRFFASREGMLLLNFGMEKKIKVSRIHITVTQDLLLGQGGQSSRDDCFSRSSLSADDDELLHFFNS